MKWVVLAVAAGSAVLAILWWLGGRVARYEAFAVLAAPPEAVFPDVTEPELLKTWIGGLVDSEPLTERGLRVGARSREVVEENGRRMEHESEVLAVEPARRLVVSIDSQAFHIESRYELEPAGLEATRLEHRMTARYRGAFRLLAPFLHGAVREKNRADLERLARRMVP